MRMTASVEERAFLHSVCASLVRYPKCRFLRPGHSTTQWPATRTESDYLVQPASQSRSSHGSEAPGARESSLHRWNGIRRLVPIDYGISTAIIAPQGQTAPSGSSQTIQAPIGPIQVPCAVITTSSAQIVSYVTQLCMSILSDSGHSVRCQVEDKVHIVECNLWFSAQDEWVGAPQ
jgi:hypothetical protein